MMYVVCNKCNVVINKHRVTGRYEMNNKYNIGLEFRCKCGNVISKHMLLKDYNDKEGLRWY